MNNDLISREALKEVIFANHYLLSAKNNSIDYGMFTTGIMQAIDNAQTVDIKDELAGAYNEGYMCGSREAEKAKPQSEWIPVSERLPDKNMKCLVSLDFGDVSFDFYNTGWGFVNYIGSVIAWQPLPESYKEGSEEK